MPGSYSRSENERARNEIVIEYTDSLENITPEKLGGFFVGWPKPPSPETHLKILQGSMEIVLAVDEETGNVVGFINAIGDGVLSAYIPLLEVLPEYKGRGIGKELVKRMMDKLDEFYSIDLTCDEDMVSFYEKQGFTKWFCMMKRNYDRQSGG